MNFYGTVAGATAYHALRHNTAWADASYDDSDREAALVRATDYIDRKYGSVFLACHFKTGGRSQERVWPLQSYMDAAGYPIPNDQVPVEVEYATYEAALRELQTPGSLQVDVAGQAGQYRQVAIEGAVSVTFAGGVSAEDYQLTVPAIEQILSPLFPVSSVLSSLSGRSVRT